MGHKLPPFQWKREWLSLITRQHFKVVSTENLKKGTKKDDLLKNQLIYKTLQLWLGYLVAMEHQMGLQTCANTQKCPGQWKRGPTVISLPITQAV